MKLRKPVLLLAAATLLPIGALAAPAAAATQPAQCTKLVTKANGTKISATLSKCTPAAATGGTGTGTFTSSGAPSGTLNIAIKWAAGKGTTKANVKFATQASKGKCPTGTTTRFKITGQVTGGTGTAFKTIKKGQPVTGSVCVGPKGYTLEPGSALKF